MKLLVLRHGESAYNRLGRCNADPAVPVPLTEEGRAQAGRAANRLRALPIRHIYVSRLQRAQETAGIVNLRHNARIVVDERLDDRRTGYEGQSVTDYLQAMSEAADPFAWKAPGGESYREMVARVHGFLAELERDPAPLVLVVSHHEPMQAIAGRYRGLDPARMWQVWVGNGETLEFEISP